MNTLVPTPSMPMTPEVISTFLVSAAGIACGLAATRLSLRSARGPRERRSVLLWVGGIWLGMVVFGVSLVVVPTEDRWAVRGGFLLLVGIAVYRCHRGQLAIRAAEQAESVEKGKRFGMNGRAGPPSSGNRGGGPSLDQ